MECDSKKNYFSKNTNTAKHYFSKNYPSYCDYLLKMGRMHEEEAVFEQIT